MLMSATLMRGMVRHEVDIKFDAVDGGLLLARDVKMIVVQLEFFEFALQLPGIHAQVKQRGNEHVAGNAANKVEVKRLHWKNMLTTDGLR